MLTLVNANEVICRQNSFFNIAGSPYYLKIKINIAKEVILYHTGVFKIHNETYIPDYIDSYSTLSKLYKIPKSSIARAIQNIVDDGGWLERTGHTGKSVKHKIIITPDKAQEFLNWVDYSKKKSKKVNRSNSVTRWDEYKQHLKINEWNENQQDCKIEQLVSIKTWWG